MCVSAVRRVQHAQYAMYNYVRVYVHVSVYGYVHAYSVYMYAHMPNIIYAFVYPLCLL